MERESFEASTSYEIANFQGISSINDICNKQPNKPYFASYGCKARIKKISDVTLFFENGQQNSKANHEKKNVRMKTKVKRKLLEVKWLFLNSKAKTNAKKVVYYLKQKCVQKGSKVQRDMKTSWNENISSMRCSLINDKTMTSDIAKIKSDDTKWYTRWRCVYM